MIKLVYKILPAFISFEPINIPWVGGYATANKIVISPKYTNDKGLLDHELTHVRQWYRTFGFHSWLYKNKKKYRLNAEVEAYKEQLKSYPDKLSYFALVLVTKPKYNLHMYTQKYVEQLLRS